MASAEANPEDALTSGFSPPDSEAVSPSCVSPPSPAPSVVLGHTAPGTNTVSGPAQNTGPPTNTSHPRHGVRPQKEQLGPEPQSPPPSVLLA